MNKRLIRNFEEWRAYLRSLGDTRYHHSGGRINEDPPYLPNSFPCIVIEQAHYAESRRTLEFLFVYTDDFPHLGDA